MSFPLSSIKSKAHINTLSFTVPPRDELKTGDPVVAAGDGLAVNDAGPRTQLGERFDNPGKAMG
jgi:hypothetical protein